MNLPHEFYEGVAARMRGIWLVVNPYWDGTPPAQFWSMGWNSEHERMNR